MGAVRGVRPAHSLMLSKGVADTVAYFGGSSDQVAFADGTTGQDLARRIVRRVFQSHRDDWRKWASLSRVLPLLAEAAPDEFLDAVDAGLAADPSPFSTLLSDSQTGQFGGSPHTGLLWALENLAWNAEYLSRSVSALPNLAGKCRAPLDSD